jgi:chitodextrinase
MKINKFKLFSFFFCLVVGVFIFTSGVKAANYYVAPGGDDNNPGTIGSPWASWLKAVNSVYAGDTVYFRSGTYPVTEYTRTLRAGTALNPITLKAYPNETPLITFGGPLTTSAMGNWTTLDINHSYWVIDGLSFESRDLPDHGSGIIYVGYDYAAEYTVLKNNHFKAIGSTARDNVACVHVGSGGRYTLIQDNVFEGFYISMPYDGVFAIQYLSSGNIGTKILNNEFKNFLFGVYIKHANGDTAVSGAEVAYNYFDNCQRPFYGQPTYVNYHDNLSNSGDIELGDNGGGVQGRNSTISHNTLFNGNLTLQNPGEGPIANSIISNNIIMGAMQPSFWGSGSLTPHNTTLNYNLYKTGASAFLEYATSYSLATWKTHYGQDANSIAGTPVFSGGANPSNISGFSLAAGSPGKNVASDGIDMGANIALVGVRASSTPDIIAPTTPAGLSATAISSSQINLSWSASTDAVGVAGYRVYRNGVLIATSSSASYSSTGLSASTAYAYNVSAFDAARNFSTHSATSTATTQAVADIIAPTTPAGLSTTAISSSQINLSWGASTDAVGVVGYRVYRNGVLIATSSSASYSSTGLSASTAYAYNVSAFDAARNFSAQSASSSATTQAAATSGSGGGSGSSGSGSSGGSSSSGGSTQLPVSKATTTIPVIIKPPSPTSTQPILVKEDEIKKNSTPTSSVVSNLTTSLIGLPASTVEEVSTKESKETFAKASFVALSLNEKSAYEKLMSQSGSAPQSVKQVLANFIKSGTPTTVVIGSGERAGVVNSYRSAFNRLPGSESDWQDVIKIANGRWTKEKNASAESRAKIIFNKIYLRDSKLTQANDSAAVNIMAYGLRPALRNLASEKTAILTFKYIFKKNPSSASDWDAVRAIAYSGAKR